MTCLASDDAAAVFELVYEEHHRVSPACGKLVRFGRRVLARANARNFVSEPDLEHPD